MVYVDYEFYTKEYYGNVISEKDFTSISNKAYDKINALTFDRVEIFFDEKERNPDSVDEKLEKKIKKAICALAERMYDMEQASNTIRANGGAAVSSISSGSESISYRTDAVISESEQNRAYHYLVRDYLQGTGLLYAGL